VSAAQEPGEERRRVRARDDVPAGRDDVEGVEAELLGYFGQEALPFLALDRDRPQPMIVVKSHRHLRGEPAEAAFAVVEESVVAAGIHRAIIDIGGNPDTAAPIGRR
jgi:hypothetical protein